MPTFQRPSSVTAISGSFASHVARKSANPGVDYRAASGTKVVSPEAGVVTGAAWSSIVGYWVHIDHDNGWSSDLLHATRNTVSVGQRVTRGQQVQVSGGTGSVATGPHIHWSLRNRKGAALLNSGNVNGEAYVGGSSGGSSSSEVDIEGLIGKDYVKKLQTALGVTADGEFGPITTKALQTKVGTPADGIWGHASNVALQQFLKIPADGLWGAQTTAAVKAAIDSGTFGTVVTPPAPPAKITRVAGTVEVRRRATPSTSSTSLQPSIAPGATVTVVGTAKGETVSGNPDWLLLEDKSWSWSGGYTSSSVAGIPVVTAPTAPTPTWPTAKYTPTKAGDFVTRIAGADWSNFENQYSVPDAASRKGFPAKPTSVVVHQWGNPGDYTLSSVVNTFQTRHEDPGTRVGAHFVVDANEIVQMVALDARAYHAGAGGNDFVGIEADPKMDAGTIANVRKVLEFLKTRNGGVALTNVLHKNVPGAATSCGTWIEPHLAELDVSKPVVDPAEVAALKAQVADLTGKLKAVTETAALQKNLLDAANAKIAAASAALK